MSILRADSIRDRAGTGAPDFPNGLTGTLTGNVTGTASTATLANTATVATNAQGLTGTPNITVGTVGCGNVTSSGDVTGVNATFSGNLTVQGTTTTIDTAVTSVDSLQIDGNVGIGTDNATSALDVRNGIIVKDQDTTQNSANPGLQLKHNGTIYGSWRHDGRLEIGGQDSNAKITLSASGLAIFKAGLAEKFQTGTTIQADPTLALSDGNIVLRTSNESGNQAINFTGVHSTLAIGEAVSFTVIITPNGSGAINAVQIDAAAQTIQWSGGSAPSAGSSGKDVYTFTLLKTGSGTTDYQVFGAATNYA
jgi:hypothetical protein